MLATAIIVALSILSCPMAEAKKNYTFAVVPKSTSSCEEQANLLTQGSDSNDIFTCLFTGPVDQDATEQVAIVKNLIDAGEVDGIALSVIDEATGDEIINSATAAGLPIITFDSDAPNSERKAYVGTDNLALGKELAHMFQSRFTKSPTGMYAILSDTNPNLILREQGIRENLREGWEEVYGSPTDFGSNATLGVD
jgi:ribose transport system substrate-binding protein